MSAPEVVETALVPMETPPSAVAALLPRNMGEAMSLAELMARSGLVPTHLQGQPANCFLVIEQATRWGMSPFAVAQHTSVIQGKLMFEGKLVAGVVNAKGGLEERLSFAYSGAGKDRTVRVSGKVRGEAEARFIDVRVADVATNNKVWTTQTDQQLAYAGARIWARRHAPELMLGVQSAEEFDPAPLPAAAPGAAQVDAAAVPATVIITPQQMRTFQALVRAKGLMSREAILSWASEQLHRDLTSSKEISTTEADELIATLRTMPDVAKAPPADAPAKTGDREPGAEG